MSALITSICFLIYHVQLLIEIAGSPVTYKPVEIRNPPLMPQQACSLINGRGNEYVTMEMLM